MTLILQIALIVLMPAVFLWMQRRGITPQWLGPVVLSYVFGILVASSHFLPLDDSVSKHISEGSILIAIPMLLFTTNVMAWFKSARSTVLSFLCCVVSAAVVTYAVTIIYHDQLPDIWQAAGMIAGVNTGGTPNMQAVGLATGASDELFIQLNAADILYGGIYLVFLTSFGPGLLSRYFPAYDMPLQAQEGRDVEQASFNWLHLLLSLLLAIAIVLAAVGSVTLVTDGELPVALIILSVTTMSVALSFWSPVRAMQSSFSGGNYLLLIFCVAIGMRSQASEIVGNSGIILQYYGITYVCTILVHYSLGWFLKIDRDTLLITSVASIYGPAFVGQIAHVLGNKHVIFGGVATGLVGYAVGNYLGLGISFLLK